METAMPETLLAELSGRSGIPIEHTRRWWTTIVDAGLASVELMERPDGSIGEGFKFDRSTVVDGVATAVRLWQAEVARWRSASMN